MKIALLAPFEEPVPPAKYGGTELVVGLLADGLTKLGHQVTVLASGDSRVNASLVPVFPTCLRAMPGMEDSKLRDAFKYVGIGRVLSYLQQHQFDVIHNHIGWRFLPFASRLNAPMVSTLHGPLTIPYQQRVFQAFNTVPYVSISLAQRRPMPDLNFAGNVYNGIALEKFPYQQTPDDYFAFLGRMSPEKGPVEAIKIAKQAGVKLVMAAKVDAVDKTYFDEEVKPLIDGTQIQFIGEVDHAGKVALLGHARALLAPIQWEEPFGLYFIEAMACGTPVITIPRGSVPEIITDKITGMYINRDLSNATDAIDRVGTISRQACRESVESHFTAEHMVRGYEAIYTSLVKTKPNALVKMV